MTLWLVILAMGVITYALRLSVIGLLHRTILPPVVERALRFVPPAVLSAIILPELVRPGGVVDVSVRNPRLLAGIVAVIVARRTKNTLATIGIGLAVLWILQAVALRVGCVCP